MYDDILIPTDGSDGVLEALEHGIDVADRYDATVHVLYVVDQRQYLGAPDEVQDEIEDNLYAEGDAAVSAVEQQVSAAGLAMTSVIREGIPHTDILEYIDEAGIDLVVMGTHGRTGRDRLTNLGSVTERVVKGSAVPVLVVDIGSS